MTKILVIPSQSYINNPSNVKQIINKEALFIERAEAEINPQYLQIIPYIIVRKDTFTIPKIFTYQRLKKGNESRLHSNWSVGIGGHIDEKYISPDTNFTDFVLDGAYRELFEELNIESNSKFLDLATEYITIFDPSNEVGKVHLGILYICDVTERNVSINETEKISGSFQTYQEINSRHNGLLSDSNGVFENWSIIALKHLGVL